MAYSLGDIVVKLKADTSNLERGLNTAEAKTHSFGGAMSKVGGILKTVAAGLAVGGVAATAFGVSSVKAYADSENKLAQLNAVLASTGGVAGVTADAAIDLSKALQKTTTFSDEEVLSAENLLLTFTKIGKDIFPQATKTVLNMATALGEDTKSASIQLGKALQDPILGVTALRRVGVNFSDDQKDVIKNLVETGRSAEAQQMILKELETEFGNSAEAARHTFGGSLKALKNQLNDVQETIGGVITKALQPFIQKAADWVASIDWEKVIKKTISALSGFKDAVKLLATGDFTGKGLWGLQEDSPVVNALFIIRDVFKAIGKAIDYLEPKFYALWNTISSKIFPVLKSLWQNVILPLIPVLGVALVAAIGGVVDAANFLINAVVTVVRNMKDFLPVLVTLAALFGALAIKMAIDNVINAVIIAFNTLRLVTIPSLLLSLQSLTAFFLTPWGLAIAAAALALGGITAMFIDHKNKINDARDALNSVNDTYKKIKDEMAANSKQLSDAMFSHEGAVLTVARAQQTYNDTVANFGPKSLEAQEAAHNLKGAQADLETKTNDLHTAQDKVNHDNEVAPAVEKAHGDSIDALTNKINNQKSMWDKVGDAIGSAWKSLKDFAGTSVHSKIPGFASGIENFGGGMAYVHAGEVLTYLPKGTSVTPANKVGQKFGSSSSTNTNIYGDIRIDSPQDADYFFKRIDRNAQLESMGVSPV